LNDDGRRQCEVLTADYNGDGCPDGISVEQCAAKEFDLGSGALQGWFYDDDDPDCEFGQIRITDDDVLSYLSDVVLGCRPYHCPEERHCPAAVVEAPRCNPRDASTCDNVCVPFYSGEICGLYEGGRPRACARCVSTVGDVCAEADPEWLGESLVVGFMGCCQEGFHCGEDGACVPDASCRCE
jgi:hypothetical protein